MEGEERKKNQSEGEVLVEMAGWILGLSQKCAGVIGRRGFGIDGCAEGGLRLGMVVIRVCEGYNALNLDYIDLLCILKP